MQWKAVFASLTNGSGRFWKRNLQELEALQAAKAAGVTDAEIERLFDIHDSLKQSYLDFNEFLEFVDALKTAVQDVVGGAEGSDDFVMIEESTVIKAPAKEREVEPSDDLQAIFTQLSRGTNLLLYEQFVAWSQVRSNSLPCDARIGQDVTMSCVWFRLLKSLLQEACLSVSC